MPKTGKGREAKRGTAGGPPPKRRRSSTDGAATSDFPGVLGPVWETGVFPLLDEETLLTTARSVGREFCRRATDSLVGRLLDGRSHGGTARSHEDEACDDTKRLVTVIVRRGHSDDFASRESLARRAARSVERCWASGYPESSEAMSRFLRSVGDRAPDAAAVERALREGGEVDASENDGWDSRGWAVRISFNASGKISDLLSKTPLDGRLITGMTRGFSARGLFTEVAWDHEEARLWSRSDGRRRSEPHPDREWGTRAIVTSRCARMLLERAVPSEARLSTQRVAIYDPELPEDPYLGCEHCLQFKVAVGDRAEEVPAEIYVLGVVRILSDFDIIPTYDLEEEDIEENRLGEEDS